MARQYPTELHIGQKVYVYVNPTTHPITARVTKIDRADGVVHVHPIGYAVRWAIMPRAIASLNGQRLYYKDNDFHFRQ